MTTAKLARTLRRSLAAGLVLALCLTLRGSSVATSWIGGVLPPTIPPLVATDRIVVIAPHCDDETLGAGGLIHDAVIAGADVRIILITNGDGYRYAVEARQRRLMPTPDQYIRFAYIRQRETLAAMRLLGLAPDHITFLGYPDRGIASLWSTNWLRGHPYRSHFTHMTQSPYGNSYTPKAPYVGQQLAADLGSLLAKYAPTIVVSPHPNDAHPDHWATNNFVNYAISRARDQGADWAARVSNYLYLAHRGEWPQPTGRHTDLPLLPPTTLTSSLAGWLINPLSPDVVALKAHAIGIHQTQTALQRSYLLSFARRNELFGQARPIAVPSLAAGAQPATPPRPGQMRLPLFPIGLAPVATDPGRDTLARRLQSGGDILSVVSGRDTTNLYIEITMVGTVSGSVSYNVHFVPLGLADGGTDRPRLDLAIRSPGRVARVAPADAEPTASVQVSFPDFALFDDLNVRPPALASVTTPNAAVVPTAALASVSGRNVRLVVPLRELGSPQLLYVGIDTTMRSAVIDRIAWTLLDLSAGEPTLVSR